MEEKMIKFLNAQKQAIEEQEKSNAIFKAAIEEVLNEKLPEPIKCNAGENKTVVHYISELDKLFPTVGDLEIYLSQLISDDADRDGYFYPPLGEIANLILNPEDDHGIYTMDYIVEKENCKDSATIIFVAKEDKPIEPEPQPEPQPEPDKPFYIFKSFVRITTSARSIIYEVSIPDDGQDYTELLQKQMNEFPSGTVETPTIVILPDHNVLTEGNPDIIGHGEDNAITIVKGKQCFIIRGGSFYTTSPFTAYGGNVQANIYSRRRHFKFIQCIDFEVDKLKITGSNTIVGSKLGTSAENTPKFWYKSYKLGDKVPQWYLDQMEITIETLNEGDMVPAPHDNGSIGNSTGYRMDWEFEHGIDVEQCIRFVIKNCFIYGVWGDGICIGVGNEDFIIAYNHIKQCGRQGVAFYNCRRGLIEYNFIDDCRRASMDPEPYSRLGYANELHFRYNKLHAVQVSIAAMGKGDVSDITVEWNEYSGGGFIIANSEYIGVMQRKNWYVANNTRTNVFGSPSSSMKFYNITNILVENNIDTLATIQSRSAAQFINCDNVIWENNNIWLKKYNAEAYLSDLVYISIRNSDINIIGGTPIQVNEI